MICLFNYHLFDKVDIPIDVFSSISRCEWPLQEREYGEPYCKVPSTHIQAFYRCAI